MGAFNACDYSVSQNTVLNLKCAQTWSTLSEAETK